MLRARRRRSALGRAWGAPGVERKSALGRGLLPHLIKRHQERCGMARWEQTKAPLRIGVCRKRGEKACLQSREAAGSVRPCAPGRAQSCARGGVGGPQPGTKLRSAPGREIWRKELRGRRRARVPPELQGWGAANVGLCAPGRVWGQRSTPRVRQWGRKDPELPSAPGKQQSLVLGGRAAALENSRGEHPMLGSGSTGRCVGSCLQRQGEHTQPSSTAGPAQLRFVPGKQRRVRQPPAAQPREGLLCAPGTALGREGGTRGGPALRSAHGSMSRTQLSPGAQGAAHTAWVGVEMSSKATVLR